MSSRALNNSAKVPLLSVKDVSKCYNIYDKPSDRLKQALWGMRKKFYKEFWALKDISFELNEGETLGVIGRNGAGKSTLLQIIAGTLMPTSGVVQTNGRVAALLELGSGFNADYSGRENVFINGAILGFTKEEMEEKFAKIAEFADIGEFIDRPIRLYSSGMVMRLAFAVTINLEPKILIIDEALAVGDERFQAKCYRHLKMLAEKGVSILFVTHSMWTVTQFSEKALLLEKGKMVILDRAKKAVDVYVRVLNGVEPERALLEEAEAEKQKNGAAADEQKSYDERVSEIESGGEGDDEKARPANITKQEIRFEVKGESGQKSAVITAAILEGQNGSAEIFSSGDEVVFASKIAIKKEVENFFSGMMIRTLAGVDCYHTNMLCKEKLIEKVTAGSEIETRFKMKLNLAPGIYVVTFDCQTYTPAGGVMLDIKNEALKLEIRSLKHIEDGGIAALGAQIKTIVIEAGDKK